MIKQIGLESRRDISDLAGGVNVHLFLFVKIKKDWMNDVESYEMMDIDKLPNKKIPRK
jgi:GTPase Era involved in 16S rRNA processing